MDTQSVNRSVKYHVCSLTMAGITLALAGCGGSSSNTNNVSVAEHTAPTSLWGGTLESDVNRPAALTLTVTPASRTSYTLGPYALGPYAVTFGQTAPIFQGDCPG